MRRQELRELVISRVAAHPDWSDRRLTVWCGCCRELVAEIRRALEADGRIEPDETRLGRDGKAYTRFHREPTTPPRLSTVTHRLTDAGRRLNYDLYASATPSDRAAFRMALSRLNEALESIKGGKATVRHGEAV